MNFLLTLILAIFVLVCKGAKEPDSAGPFPPLPRPVTFGRISHGGDGCPQGSVSQSISPNGTSFVFSFSAYVVTSPFSFFTGRKNCQVNMAVNIPVGWQYSVKTNYRGFEKLDAGVNAKFSALYYFSGERQEITNTTVHKGELDTRFFLGDVFPTSSTIWSPCQRSTNLNIALAVDMVSNKGSSGQVRVIQQFGKLNWRRC